ncbi:hypothetical protein QJS10_CPB15g02061 [Acorus calamus]|uniref:FLZ-type domain-containing protein n=1 Tax=Acorus calamus TaxID=4465 RepID=A0AAV9D8R3_ACOCL|nr:hypothetical protein QJS10_CPB15g02061 [Acorus calamus]
MILEEGTKRNPKSREGEEMLRKRSRAVTSKQGLMSDKYINRPKSTITTNPSIFTSPRLFVGFSSKPFSDTESVMSPTSTLDTKPFSTTIIPTTNTTTTFHESKHFWPIKSDSRGITDALPDEPNDTKPSKMVLFGSQLKLQIPLISPTGSLDSPQSPIQFGVKTRNSQLGLLSSYSVLDVVASPPPVFTSDMELSEDYTCVISRGPNPKTTHIFDNCIIESRDNGFPALKREGRIDSGYLSDDFLSSCYACKKKLGVGKDIYMYRGDKAFCSRECRYQEMLFNEEGMENCASEPPVAYNDEVFDYALAHS